MRFARSCIALCATLVLSSTAGAQRAAPPPADLIVINARIYTVDDSHPFVSAMAVRNGRVQFVGSNRETMLLRGPSTRVIDAAGQTVIPGLVDTHLHVNEPGRTDWEGFATATRAAAAGGIDRKSVV